MNLEVLVFMKHNINMMSGKDWDVQSLGWGELVYPTTVGAGVVQFDSHGVGGWNDLLWRSILHLGGTVQVPGFSMNVSH